MTGGDGAGLCSVKIFVGRRDHPPSPELTRVLRGPLAGRVQRIARPKASVWSRALSCAFSDLGSMAEFWVLRRPQLAGLESWRWPIGRPGATCHCHVE